MERTVQGNALTVVEALTFCIPIAVVLNVRTMMLSAHIQSSSTMITHSIEERLGNDSRLQQETTRSSKSIAIIVCVRPTAILEEIKLSTQHGQNTVRLMPMHAESPKDQRTQ